MRRTAAIFGIWFVLGGAGLTPALWSVRWWLLVIGIWLVIQLVPVERSKAKVSA